MRKMIRINEPSSTGKLGMYLDVDQVEMIWDATDGQYGYGIYVRTKSGKELVLKFDGMKDVYFKILQLKGVVLPNEH